MNVNFGLFPPLERRPKAEDGKRLRGPAQGRRPEEGADRPGAGRSGRVDSGASCRWQRNDADHDARSSSRCAAALLGTITGSLAFDSDSDTSWGAPYNSHLDPYNGRPLGPPLASLPPGYQYYNGRLIWVLLPACSRSPSVRQGRVRRLAQRSRPADRR